MKKLKLFTAALVCAATLAPFAFAGCNGKDGGQTADNAGGAVSYLSAQTQVFSSTAEVVDAVADAVVEISTETVTTRWGQQYIVSGAGSGVIVGSNESVYYVVTNNHVIDGANDITVTTRAGEEFEATLLATDDSADIAVVTVRTESALSVAVWGDSDGLKVGEDLIAIGNPLGSLGGTVTKGILSAKGRSITVGDFSMTLLQTDTAINPGNSGGGLFNMRGELIGVVNAKTSDEEIEGICFAIPANTARAVYNDLMQYGYILGRATFNLTLAETTVSSGGINAQQQQIVYISADPAGDGSTFKKYDMISKINGRSISSVLEYNVALSEISPGDSVQAEVYRGTVTQGFFGNSITFASQPTTFTVTAVQYGA